MAHKAEPQRVASQHCKGRSHQRLLKFWLQGDGMHIMAVQHFLCSFQHLFSGYIWLVNGTNSRDHTIPALVGCLLDRQVSDGGRGRATGAVCKCKKKRWREGMEGKCPGISRKLTTVGLGLGKIRDEGRGHWEKRRQGKEEQRNKRMGNELSKARAVGRDAQSKVSNLRPGSLA